MSDHVSNLSRRGFLKNMGAAAVGSVALASGVSLTGCSKEQDASAKDSTWDKEADVVVIGFGGSGACAAIEAADNGAKVLILEKHAQASHLCNTAMAGGNYHCPDASGDKKALKAYNRAMASGEGLAGVSESLYPNKMLDALIDAFTEGEYETTAFLQSLDPDFNPIERGSAALASFPGAETSGFKLVCGSYTDKPIGPKYPTMDLPKEETAGGLALFNCLKAGIENRSDSIEVLYNTPADTLIVDEDGTVTGAVAHSDEKTLRIKATKGVVLCSGGYEYGEEMRDAFLEGPSKEGYAFYGNMGNTGDGIKMAIQSGARLFRAGHSFLKYIWKCPEVTEGSIAAGAMTDAVGSDGTILVNSLGKRFINEGSYIPPTEADPATGAYNASPAYLIFDETRRQSSSLVNLTYGNTGFGIIDWKDDANQSAIEAGWILSGQTIEELAENIKSNHEENAQRMNAENLRDTLERYSTIVETGVDDQFGRTTKTSFAPIATPPFYALPVYAGGAATLGGLLADESSRVLGWDGEAIPHLYSAGEISSMWKGVSQGGSLITECIVRGRIAGKSAATSTSANER